MKVVMESMYVSVDFCKVDILPKNVEFSSSLFLLLNWVDSLKSLRRKAKSCDNCEIASFDADVAESSVVGSIFVFEEIGKVDVVVSFNSGVFQTLKSLSPYTTRVLFSTSIRRRSFLSHSLFIQNFSYI